MRLHQPFVPQVRRSQRALFPCGGFGPCAKVWRFSFLARHAPSSWPELAGNTPAETIDLHAVPAIAQE